MMPVYAQLILCAHNLLNVWLDAYKIKRALKKNIPKSVRHGANLAAYCVTAAALIWWQHSGVWEAIVFTLSAFFQRQLSFDIPLNLRRGLPWNYVSLDKPPKALMDRIEVRIFGYNGSAPVLVYGVLWVSCLLITGIFFR